MISVMPLRIARDGSSPEMRPEIAGSKAAQLWQMTQLGLDVPPAFVLPTTLCADVSAGDAAALEAMRQALAQGLVWLEDITGLRFGDSRAPLLVSVRSGAAFSMPGMLETILNVGLNDETLRGFIRKTGNPRLAFDSFRRLVQGYAEVVSHVPAAKFDVALTEMMRRECVEQEADLDPEALERLTMDFREIVLNVTGKPIPEDPRDQLNEAALAVYRSWNSPKAREYRRINALDHLAGTAVTVQAMVFGNGGGSSGAGVAFSRNPATGERTLYVDFLFDAQGEDVVSGRHEPGNLARLMARLPEAGKALADGTQKIESLMRDAQDVEFTIAEGRLYFLQARSAKRTPLAALRIAVDMVHEGLIDRATALRRLACIDIANLKTMRFEAPAPAVATAISAAPGVASGHAVFDSQRAKDLARKNEPVILVRRETSTEDVEGFAVASGILTAVGGRTAHAAVVARQLGKVCLVGCKGLVIDDEKRQAAIGNAVIREGDWLSLDGDRGEVSLGQRTIVADSPPVVAEVLAWRAEGAGCGVEMAEANPP